MRKLYIVKNNNEFENIIMNGNCIKNKYYIIHSLPNKLPYDRFGISVSKKLGNAVFRNKYKRKLRAIIDNYKKNYINNKDYSQRIDFEGSPVIRHFFGPEKPWNTVTQSWFTIPYTPHFKDFWFYAKITPYFEEIKQRFINEKLRTPKD